LVVLLVSQPPRCDVPVSKWASRCALTLASSTAPVLPPSAVPRPIGPPLSSPANNMKQHRTTATSPRHSIAALSTWVLSPAASSAVRSCLHCCTIAARLFSNWHGGKAESATAAAAAAPPPPVYAECGPYRSGQPLVCRDELTQLTQLASVVVTEGQLPIRAGGPRGVQPSNYRRTPPPQAQT
jgi:hypothetical protein